VIVGGPGMSLFPPPEGVAFLRSIVELDQQAELFSRRRFATRV
jgi:hypothetical protein